MNVDTQLGQLAGKDHLDQRPESRDSPRIDTRIQHHKTQRAILSKVWLRELSPLLSMLTT